MCKYVYSLYLIAALTAGIAFGMDTQQQSNAKQEDKVQTDADKQGKIQAEKVKIDKEVKKNKAYLRKIKSNEKLAPALEKVEGIVSKIVTSPEFKAIIEKIANKQAQEIMQGKTFGEVKYNHSLSTAFPKLTTVNPFVAYVYSWMANIEQSQLLLSKLNNPQEIKASSEPEKPKEGQPALEGAETPKEEGKPAGEEVKTAAVQ